MNKEKFDPRQDPRYSDALEPMRRAKAALDQIAATECRTPYPNDAISFLQAVFTSKAYRSLDDSVPLLILEAAGCGQLVLGEGQSELFQSLHRIFTESEAGYTRLKDEDRFSGDCEEQHPIVVREIGWYFQAMIDSGLSTFFSDSATHFLVHLVTAGDLDDPRVTAAMGEAMDEIKAMLEKAVESGKPLLS